MSNQKVFSNSSPGSPAILLSSSPRTSSSLRAALLSTPKCVSDLLLEFPDVLSSDGFTASPPCHPILHQLLAHPGPPVFAKACCLDPDKLAVSTVEFSTMEKVGIIRSSTSPWAFPLHMVKKKDGLRRRMAVGDNAVIIGGGYTLLLFLIAILSPTLPILPRELTVLLCFPNWTFRKDTIRCQFLWRTSRKPPSSPPAGYSNFFACLLDAGTLVT